MNKKCSLKRENPRAFRLGGSSGHRLSLGDLVGYAQAYSTTMTMSRFVNICIVVAICVVVYEMVRWGGAYEQVGY